MAYIIHVSCWIATSLTVLNLVHSFSLVNDVFWTIPDRFTLQFWDLIYVRTKITLKNHEKCWK